MIAQRARWSPLSPLIVLVIATATLAAAPTARAKPAAKPAAQTAARPAPRPAVRTVGNLVWNGAPETPVRIAQRMNQYLNVRDARFFDFHPDQGVLIGTRFGETTQLHHVLAPGSARRQLTFFSEPVLDAMFDGANSRNGFLFVKDVGGNEAYQTYAFDDASGRERLLTDGVHRNGPPLPNRAGNAFAYASTQRNGKDWDLWVSVDRKAPRQLASVTGQWSPLDWADDDAHLLVLKYVSINESALHVLDASSGKMQQIDASPTPVAYRAAAYGPRGTIVFASDRDSEVARLWIHDPRTGQSRLAFASQDKWSVTRIVVSKDRRRIAWVANEGGADAVYLASTSNLARSERLKLEPGVVTGLGFDATGKRLGLSVTTARSPGDVYTVDTASRRMTRWTQSEVGGLDPGSFVTPTLVETTSFDGRKIPGWYFAPKRPGPVPLLVMIHGGPESQSRPDFSSFVQYLVVELGVAVLLPNVRGSDGYGKTYLLLDNGMKREDSVKDIGAFLDWAAARPEIDAKRIGVYGGSYGGYMVLASMVHFGKRLRCGIDVVGISNFVTFLQNTQDYRRDQRRAEYGDERDPAMRAHLLAISPLTSAARIDKPLFVVQGQNDPRVPVTEADQIVETVRALGRPVWYLLALDEGHGFRKKQNRDASLAAMVHFLEKFLVAESGG